MSDLLNDETAHRGGRLRCAVSVRDAKPRRLVVRGTQIALSIRFCGLPSASEIADPKLSSQPIVGGVMNAWKD